MNAIFYGLEPQWFGNDRAYKVYEGDGSIVGIRVGGQFFDKTSVRTQLSPLYVTVIGIPIVEAIVVWVDRRRREKEELADRDFTLARNQKDSRAMALSDVESVGLSTRRRWWTIGRNSGTVTIRGRNGATWELIVTGKQDMEAIAVVFGNLGIPIQKTA